MELPPRARRIPPAVAATADIRGTTSACAENTGATIGHPLTSWNYLRVRGEYTAIPLIDWLSLGTTSACAENTRVPRRNCPTIRNYLRVRGEYRKFFAKFKPKRELPPRARRILIGVYKTTGV